MRRRGDAREHRADDPVAALAVEAEHVLRGNVHFLRQRLAQARLGAKQPAAHRGGRYVERSGRNLDALRYYETLSLFKLAIILEGPSARRRLAGVPESRNNAATIDRLMGGAADFARGVRT